MPDQAPSAEYTIRMGEGVSDRLTEIREFLSGPGLKDTNAAHNYADLAKLYRENLETVQSYLRCLTSLITTTPHDGDQYIYLDFCDKSFGFRYNSGYHGGMIHRPTEWSIHT